MKTNDPVQEIEAKLLHCKNAKNGIERFNVDLCCTLDDVENLLKLVRAYEEIVKRSSDVGHKEGEYLWREMGFKKNEIFNKGEL